MNFGIPLTNDPVEALSRERELASSDSARAQRLIESMEALGIDASELRLSRQRVLDTLSQLGLRHETLCQQEPAWLERESRVREGVLDAPILDRQVSHGGRQLSLRRDRVINAC